MRGERREILAFDHQSLKCGIMSEEQGMLWRPSFVEAGRWQHNYRESSHNTWLNKQCMSSPPKVPVSSVFCFHAWVYWTVALRVFVLAGRKKEVNLCLYANVWKHTQTYREIWYADKQAMDSRLMYLCSNGLKLKQDKKGLHFREAALPLMTRGPPTAISAYYNLEMALLCF